MSTSTEKKRIGRPPKNKIITPPEPKIITPTPQPLYTEEPKRILVSDDVASIPYEPPSFDRQAANQHPHQEVARQILARQYLLDFILRFRPKYLPGWVHKDICRRLERFIKQVEQKLSPRLLLMMPPRSGKSEIGSRHLAPWALGQHPDWEIIAASHTSSLSLSFSRYIRDLMEDEAYKVLFPEALIDPSSRSVENWNLKAGGGYLAAGVGTGITGRGAHILLLDDLVKDMEAADSPTIKDNTWEWYGSTAYTRLAPGGGVIGIMTHWSEDDWAGRIQKTMENADGDKFEIVRYPAINDEGDEYLLQDDRIIEVLPGDTPPSTVKEFIRPHNTAVHPARYDTQAMLRIKNNLIATGQKRVWQALYQQNPTPDDGLFFTKDMLRYYPTLPHKRVCKVYQAWDFAITEEKTSDYTVGVTIYQDARDNLYVVDVRRFRSDDSIMIVNTILDYYEEYDADMIGFEDGQIWKAMEAFFSRSCEERHLYPAFEILKPLTDKMVRAAPLRGRMQTHKVFFDEKAPWFSPLSHELMRFPAGKHDDQIDALAWAVRLSLMYGKPKDEAPPPTQKSWRDRIASIGSGQNEVSHMSA